MVRCACTIRIMLKETHGIILLAAAFFCSPIAGLDIARAEEKTRVFEIRTYYANEGKLDALLARFRDRAEMDAFIKSTLSQPHIERTNTSLVLNTVKQEPRVIV